MPTLPSFVTSISSIVLMVSFGASGRDAKPFRAVLLTVKCVVPCLSVIGVLTWVLEVPFFWIGTGMMGGIGRGIGTGNNPLVTPASFFTRATEPLAGSTTNLTSALYVALGSFAVGPRPSPRPIPLNMVVEI